MAAKRRAAPPPTRAPEVLAAIDVGATSVRMEIVESHPDGILKPLDQLVHPVTLAGDTFRHGHIRPETLRALSRVLANFAAQAAEYHAAALRVVTTSAIREASNQEIVVDRVRHTAGVSLEVLDTVEEARLTYQALVPALATCPAAAEARQTLLLSLGGGMTEFMLLDGSGLVTANSRRLGTARLLHAAVGAADEDAHAFIASMAKNIVDSAFGLYRDYPVDRLLFANGLLTRVARQAPGVRQQGAFTFMTSEAAQELLATTRPLASDRLARRYGLRQNEAELLETALLILDCALAARPVPVDVAFSDFDMLGGVLRDLALERRGVDPRADYRREIVRAARTVGEKYRYHREHGEHVAKLAVQLFDGLAAYLDLTPEDRTHLEVAAILHDIGMFVSEMEHHKHGAYLVRHTELVGLEEPARILVSQVVRYHRRAVPGPHHEDFRALPPPMRLKVRKLAALLRLADALDRTHRQPVRSIEPELDAGELRLWAESAEELGVEAAALTAKADLFEQITGLTVRLTRRYAGM